MPSILNFKITPPPAQDSTSTEEDDTFLLHRDIDEEEEKIVYEEIDSITPEPRDDKDLIDEIEDMIDINLVKKPEIDRDEIFANAPPRKRGQPTRSTSPKKVTRKPRKPLSDEAKENRRKALEKGRATRAANLAEKRRLKNEQEELQNQSHEMDLESQALDLELKNAKLNKKAKKVKQVIIDDSSSEEEIQYVKRPKKKLPQSPPPSRSSITAEDIEQAQINTLLAYEKIRKDRKAEKLRIKKIEQEQSQIRETMKSVNHSQPAWGRHRGAGKYGNLLSGMGL